MQRSRTPRFQSGSEQEPWDLQCPGAHLDTGTGHPGPLWTRLAPASSAGQLEPSPVHPAKWTRQGQHRARGRGSPQRERTVTLPRAGLPRLPGVEELPWPGQTPSATRCPEGRPGEGAAGRAAVPSPGTPGTLLGLRELHLTRAARPPTLEPHARPGRAVGGEGTRGGQLDKSKREAVR